MSLPSVSRKTDKGLPRYDDGGESDVFVISGAEDLVPVLDGPGNRIRSQRTVHGVLYEVSIYRPRTEGLFSRIERWKNTATGISHWRSITHDNVTTLFGFDAGSRIADPDDPKNVFTWLISRSFDDRGNLIRYDYAADNGAGIDLTQAHEMNRTAAMRGTQHYIKRIRYGNQTPWFPTWSSGGSEPALPTDWHFEVVFDYGDHPLTWPVPMPPVAPGWPVRPDPFSSYRSGFEVRTYRRCRRVLMFHHFTGEAGVGNDCLTASTDFLYSDEVTPSDPANPIYTFLASVTQMGYRQDGSGGYISRSMPPVEFEYSTAAIQSDLLTLDPPDFGNLPEGIDGSRFQWVDLDGEGLSGVLMNNGEGGWGYRRNLSPLNRVASPDGVTTRARLGPMENVPSLPSRSNLTDGRVRLMDLAGDGHLDVVLLDDPVPGFFERTADGSWVPFRGFASLPQIDWSDPNLRIIDLTGDGLGDALVTDSGVFTMYPSLGEQGFGQPERVATGWNEERGPQIVFADGTETIFLADMSGDGLSDIVRVRNGEISYWPNLGYGRFGPRVSMDRAPRFTHDELFDPKRIRLTDIDGSGSTDVLYVGDDGVLVCFNRSGNVWADPQLIAVFPTADSLSSVQVLDLLGNGTACLVWSSPLPAQEPRPLLYVDLMGGVKPHLMIASRNNLGAEKRVRYAPSTKFYLADKMAGRPWITKLPNIVHVVERTESYDFIGRSRFVTRYAYHHGYFDGYDREFRGFGMVEQWDTEEHRDDTDFPEAEATNWDSISWVPPVHTKTWFHTGAFDEAGKVTRQYMKEYWAEPAMRGEGPAEVAAREALLLPDTVLPTGLTPEEQREAYRALKGSALRSEVYAEDGSARAEHPYSVTERNFTIRTIQPKGPNRYPVFLVHQREVLLYDYERQPDDPRIKHDVTLEIDDFGNVERTASVAYGRRPGYATPEPDLSSTFQDMLAYDQSRMHVGGTQNSFTTPVNQPWSPTLFDVYRAPMPRETIVAELTGITPLDARFAFEEIDLHWIDLWSGSYDLPYEEIAASDIDGAGAPPGYARRIVEQTRRLYRSDDMEDLLPLGTLESHALPGEAYRLALTPDLIDRIYGGMVDASILDEGGYVQLAGGDEWWVPSGRLHFSPGDGDTAAQELAEARAHFYTPRRAIDPFGAVARIAYDGYDLLPLELTDPIGNVTTAEYDYRVLQPGRVIDVNGNWSEVAFDCFGMVAGAAVCGKAGEGDSLAGFDPDLSEATILDVRNDPLDDPGAILGDATSRTLIDRFAYYRTRHLPEPDAPMVYTLTRETHVSDLAPGETTRFSHLIMYSDGFGREAQYKAPAEPGPVIDGGPVVSPRWVASGWMIYDNKGNPVRQYEPFFSATHQFEFDMLVGVGTVVYYDPTGRVVATLHPDGSFEKIIIGAWRQESWDHNDTVLIDDPRTDPDVGDFFERLLGTAPGAFTSWHDRRIGGAFGDTAADRAANQDAAQKAALHADTPSVAHFDSTGRRCLEVADNGMEAGVPQRYATRTAWDAENRPLALIDARERRVVEYSLREPDGGGGFVYVAGYDLAGSVLYHNGMDGGARFSLSSVFGDTIRTWNARDLTVRFLYDELRRPTHRYVDQSGSGETLAERFVYGDRHADDSLNLKGRMFRHYDGGGVATFDRYDFKGNLLESGRQFALHTPSTVSPPDLDREPDWLPIETITDTPALDTGALDSAASPLLDPTDVFTASSRFDAHNRPIQSVMPHLAGGALSVVQPVYNEAKLLEAIDVWLAQGSVPTGLLTPATADIHAVTGIEYNARGQRTGVSLGNGSITTYTYDPETFRTSSITTTRPNSDARARTVQALAYTYDPAGNITRVRDDADIHNVVYFRNRRVDPTADYTYDPLYRLKEATGREHLGLTGTSLSAPQQPTNDDSFRSRIPSPGDGRAVDTYRERYTYDQVGNLLAMMHQVASGRWTRRYAYTAPSRITSDETSNRLTSTSMPGDPAAGPYSATYRYDVHGNMTRMPHLPRMTWDAYDRLQSTARQVVGSGMPETTYYQYDAGGQRIRKVTYRQTGSGGTPTRKTERLYIGPFEIYREYDSTGSTIMLERETLSVMLDAQRTLTVETRTVDVLGTDPAPAQMIRYQYGNHLGSTSLRLDENADLVSYEEYFPYGSTSYQAVRNNLDTPPRYRYTGKERDEENDLYYHGARYYAPWLGRWISCDPAGVIDGHNLYRYSRNSPVNYSDPDGMQAKKGTKEAKKPDQAPSAAKDSTGTKPAAPGGAGTAKEEPKAPPLPSEDELVKRIAASIGIKETGNNVRESDLTTIAGVSASFASITQTIMENAVQALKESEALRNQASPALTKKEVLDAEKREIAINKMWNKLMPKAYKDGVTADDFITNNAATVTASGLTNDDVKTMYKAFTLETTLKTAVTDAKAAQAEAIKTAKAAKQKNPNKAGKDAYNTSFNASIDAIPEADRLGISKDDLGSYAHRTWLWGDNRAAMQRKSVNAMPGNVGARIETLVEANGGRDFALGVIRTNVQKELGKKTVPTLEQIVKNVATANNPGEKGYAKQVWDNYVKLYGTQ